MDTEKYHKNNRSTVFKSLLFLLLPLGFLSSFLIYHSSKIIFAQEDSSLSDTDVKGAFFMPNTFEERISYGPKLITIKKEEKIYTVLTKLTDIYEILRQNSIELERQDIIYMNTEYLLDGSIVRIVRSETIIVEEFFDIPYEEEIVKSNMYLKGQRNIFQEGELGIGKRILSNTYEDGLLVNSELIEQTVVKEPIKRIVEVGTSLYLLKDIELRGYNCPFWYSVVESGPYTPEEMRWLKFIMYCESGCNAESDKDNYKGLFQWSPYWWSRQFKENIFDGFAQIKNTIGKYRAGESTRESQWPACHKKYRSVYPL